MERLHLSWSIPYGRWRVFVVHSSVDRGQPKPTEQDLLKACLDAGVQDIVSVPCSITDTWQWLTNQAAREQRLRLVMTTHEGNLAGIATGIWFGKGRPALVHLQNSGLFSAGDGFLTLAGEEVYQIPIAAVVTWRGWGSEDTSEPHQAIGHRTEELCRLVFGSGACILGDRDGGQILDALRATLAAARAGNLGVLRLSPRAFHRTAMNTLPGDFAQIPSCWLDRLREKKGDASLPESLRFHHPPTRDAALLALAAAHPRAAMIYANGFTSRAAHARVDRPGSFYNVGCMGSSLAVGWGLATSRPDLEVVVVDGDQNAQMSTMKEQLTAQYPPNLHWYILNNHVGASVGTAESLPLSPMYHHLARVIETKPDEPGSFIHPRVMANGANMPHALPAGEAPRLAHLARGFRAWVESTNTGEAV